MKMQVIMFWTLLGCFAASTAMNFQLLSLARDAQADLIADPNQRLAIDLQPMLDDAVITDLQSLALSKQQRESIRKCSMT